MKLKNLRYMAMLLLVGLMTVFSVGCSKVPAGNVGVKFNLYGGEKGVQIQELPPGRYWIGWNEELYTFPTFTQTETWEGDESLSFGTTEGLQVNADIGITYHIAPDKVTKLFQTYRKGVNEITDLYLRNMVRDSLVKQGSNIGIESVYGKGKSQLIEAVEKDVRDQVHDLGIEVEKVYWIGNLRLPQNVTKAINAKIQATQMAQQRENEVAQAKAEAQKAVAVAEGEAAAKLAVATAEAKAITLRGDALRNNPGIVQLNWVEKWDGKLPVTSLGANTSALIQLP